LLNNNFVILSIGLPIIKYMHPVSEIDHLFVGLYNNSTHEKDEYYKG